MIDKIDTVYAGLECVQLKNDQLALWITKSFGPRLIGLEAQGGENLLAVLPDARIPVEGREDYSLRGGHRLWVAPERPETTYVVDDAAPEIVPAQAGLDITQPVDRTGIQKSWQVRLPPEDLQVTLNHRLTNRGEKTVRLAPWAVTMLPPGGVGLLPLQQELEDEHGLWPNRQLLVWPYTELNSPYLDISDHALRIRAEMTVGALKVGAPNPAGWLAYRQREVLFIKRTEYSKGANYPDRGASHEIYCSPTVIELETLGPLLDLAPGESVDHREIWQVYLNKSWPEEIKELFQDF